MVYGKVMIASVPRTGCTYLLRSILGLPYSGGTPAGGNYKRDKPFIRPNITITHSCPERVLQDKWKVIFTFGNPLESIISTKRRRMDTHHFSNCGVYDINPEECDIYSKDILGYETIFNKWTTVESNPVMCVKYETMNKHFNDIEDWIGRKIKWIPWKLRNTNTIYETKENIDMIKNTYKTFINKYNKMPEVLYLNKELL